MSRSESGSGAVARAWSWLLGVLVFLVLLQLVWAMFQSVLPGLRQGVAGKYLQF